MLVKRPIYNQQLHCVAFEILSHQKIQPNEEFAHSIFQLIHNSDTELPLFIPFYLKNTLEQFELPINNPIILKLPAEDIESIYSLAELQDSLFSIALLINTPQQLAWLNFAEYIALTEQLINRSDVTKVIRFSKAQNRKVIAYDLNNPVSFDKCKTMTMDYYCGDFLFKPIDKDSSHIAANKLNILHLIQTLQQDDCSFDAITKIVQTDPLLSFQVLKIANSAFFTSRRKIESIDQAVLQLGMVHLKNWLTLLSMKNITDKPIEVLESGLIRAYMAEKLAKSRDDILSQSAYIAGLLSILDCLLDKPMSELISQIALADEIQNALLNYTGPLGELLALVIAYEKGYWENVSGSYLGTHDLSKLYIDSLDFIAKTMHGK